MTNYAYTSGPLIARGGFGRVEEVWSTSGERLARKTFDPSLDLGAVTPEEIKKLRVRFEREVRIQTQFKGHGVFPILEANLKVDPPWYVMPLAEKTYQQQIEEDRLGGAVTSKPLFDILNSLDEIHRLGYVHRDLKPGNVLLLNGKWLLGDFGLAADADHTTTKKLTGTHSKWGSHLYMAPEQIVNFGHVSQAADIYAFGCILHDLVDGGTRIPYSVLTSQNDFADILKKCTAELPSKRFKAVSGLRDALAEVLQTSKGGVQPTAQLAQWRQDLENIGFWNSATLLAFIRVLGNTAPGKEDGMAASLKGDHFDALSELSPDHWDIIAGRYCDWAHGDFDFDFCDVIVSRLERVFHNKCSSMDVKAAAIVAMVKLGYGHHRFHVMGRVIQIAGPSMDDVLAQRMAIEIYAGGLAPAFRACATVINHQISSYHPRIAAALG